jgi:hypothetical protein
MAEGSRSERRAAGPRASEHRRARLSPDAAPVLGPIAGGVQALGGVGSADGAVVVCRERMAGERRMLSVKPEIEVSDVDKLGELHLDVYGTPWGRVLSGADPDVLTVSGTATVRIPAGIPDVE